MTKIIHTLFVSLALLVVLSSAGLAHHHHNGEVHFVLEQANDSDCCNTDTESKDQNNDCVFEKEYCNTADKDVDLLKNIKELLSFPLAPFFQLQIFNFYDEVIVTSKWNYLAPHIPYSPKSNQGLRAPPLA